MKVKITMINGNTFEFENTNFSTMDEFLENQVSTDYYTIDPIKGLAIRTSNILKIEHLDIGVKK